MNPQLLLPENQPPKLPSKEIYDRKVTELYVDEAFLNYLKRTAFSKVHKQARAEGIVHEAFEVIFEQWIKYYYKPKDDLKKILYRIVFNMAVNDWKRTTNSPIDEKVELEVVERIKGEDTFEDALKDLDVEQCQQSFKQKLGARENAVLDGKLNGHQNEVIANNLGITKDQVKATNRKNKKTAEESIFDGGVSYQVWLYQNR